MTKEEKQLLIKDLCARLPYGVKILDDTFKKYGASELINIGIDGSMLIDNIIDDIQYYPIIDNIKPYLRPMSSMADDERDEFRNVGGVMSHDVQNDTWAISAFAPEAYDWLNKHHFDYRGLIPMGLALEAPEDMYKTE